MQWPPTLPFSTEKVRASYHYCCCYLLEFSRPLLQLFVFHTCRMRIAMNTTNISIFRCNEPRLRLL